MNTRANIALLPWWKRQLYRLLGTPFADPPLQLPAPKNYNHEKALRDQLRKGISIGESHLPPIVYSCFCERHNIRLHETLPGVFVCMMCQTGPMQPITEPVQPAHPRLLSYLEQKNPHPSIRTAKFRAIHLVQKARQG